MFQLYVAECVRICTENTAKVVQGGVYVEKKLVDIMKPQVQEEEKNAAEIIFEVMSRSGVTFLE